MTSHNEYVGCTVYFEYKIRVEKEYSHNILTTSLRESSHLHRVGHRIPNLLSSLFGLRSFAHLYPM